jgi:hypothetical protein
MLLFVDKYHTNLIITVRQLDFYCALALVGIIFGI